MTLRWQALAAILLASCSLAACASVHPGRVAGAASSDYGHERAPDQDRREQSQNQRPRAQAQRGTRIPGTMRPYQVAGRTYTPRDQPHYNQTGIASWYGPQFHNRATANGEVFDMDAITAAHTTLPLPSIVEVTNLENNRTIRVRVNDRGPFVNDRIIDLSRGAAQRLGFHQQGTTSVRVRYVGPAGRDLGDDLRFAQATSVNRPPAQTLAESRPAASESRSRNGLRVQVGAFSTRLNAERAAERVTGAGPVTINTLDRDGSTLFLVSLGPANDARSADRLRDRAAEAGFPDARIIGF